MMRTWFYVAAVGTILASFELGFLQAAALSGPPQQVIASSLGPAGEYNGNLTYVAQWFSGITRSELAVQFTPVDGDYLLTTTRLALFKQFAGAPTPRLDLAESAGRVPGAVIASRLLENVPVDPLTVDHTELYDVDWSPLGLRLRQGVSYWLVLGQTAASNFSELRWFVNGIGSRALWAARDFSQTTGAPNPWVNNDFFTLEIPAFSVSGTPIPEPSPAIGLILTAAGAVIVRRGRRLPNEASTQPRPQPEG